MKGFITIIFLAFLTFPAIQGRGQYYYNDLLSVQQGAEQYKLLRGAKVRNIQVTGYDSDNQPTEGFLLEQAISPDGKKITINDATVSGKKNTTVNTYELGKLKRVQASGNGIENRTDYVYDDKGRLQKSMLTTADTAMKYTTSETHEWTYDENSQPRSMLKIRNRTDTTFISFVKDEQGNIAEEHWKRKGTLPETYYYYYNARNQLTDIVRFNNKLKKLLPDYLYEYDANGRVTQMTQVALGTGNYLTWQYSYTDKGLKQKEVCFDKSKKVLGSIMYTYEY